MEAYCFWSSQFLHVYPALSILLNTLPYIPISQRKCILTFCRVQPLFPISESRFFSRFADLLNRHIRIPEPAGNTSPVSFRTYTLISALEDLEHERLDPIIHGLVASATISAPYATEDLLDEVMEVKDETIQKELSAAQSWKIAGINYTSWLGPLDRVGASIPVYPDLPVAFGLQSIIKKQFAHARRSIRGKVVFPQFGDKTFGKTAQKRIQECLLGRRDLPGYLMEPKTIQDLEEIYYLTGIELEGPTEVRSAWRYNDLKPRVYYAQGPSVFQKSKFIQPLCNLLIDSFPIVHRHDRFSNPRLPESTEFLRLALYDYSSFTSRLTEIRRFVNELATYFEGVEIIVVDGVFGPMSVDVSDILRSYNDTCNDFPEMDVTRVLDLDEVLLMYHSCGMLGVPGNISLSTLLHGLHLASIIGDIYSAKCIGDDAAFLLNLDPRDVERWNEIMSMIQRIGDCNADKTETFDSGPLDPDPSLATNWHYAKRPINLMFTGIYKGDLAIIPSLELTLGLEDRFHKASSSMENPIDRVMSLLSQTRRFIDRAYYQQWSITPTGNAVMEVMLLAVRKIIQKLGKRITGKFFRITSGNVSIPSSNGKKRFLGVWIGPECWDQVGKKDFVSILADARPITEVEAPLFSMGTKPIFQHVGSVDVGDQDALLSYLRKVSVIESEYAGFQTYKLDLRLDSDRAFFRIILLGQFVALYRFTLVKELPWWFDSARSLL